MRGARRSALLFAEAPAECMCERIAPLHARSTPPSPSAPPQLLSRPMERTSAHAHPFPAPNRPTCPSTHGAHEHRANQLRGAVQLLVAHALERKLRLMTSSHKSQSEKLAAGGGRETAAKTLVQHRANLGAPPAVRKDEEARLLQRGAEARRARRRVLARG